MSSMQRMAAGQLKYIRDGSWKVGHRQQPQIPGVLATIDTWPDIYLFCVCVSSFGCGGSSSQVH